MDTAPPPPRDTGAGFDIFCRVIDNYGDIGVCWRLARQLAGRANGAPVRLWVDDLASFARIEAAIDTRHGVAQTVRGVQVHAWEQAEHDAVRPLPVVIEAFACDLPPAYLARMRAGAHHWVNLEYLSAEGWVEECHGLPSPQANGVAKRFFFPGFTARTGGLLREPGLLEQRDGWRRDPARRTALLQGLGVPAAWIEGLASHGWKQCYAFCYPHAPLQAVVDALQAQPRPTVLLAAPNAPATRDDSGKVLRFDCPFVDQAGFDTLLWGSDLNLVRGEDSLVRAIWAARPFLWHIYPQREDTHLEKLDAWLALCPAPCTPEAASLMRAWNRGDAGAVGALLSVLMEPRHWRAWQAQARCFSDAQAGHADLAGQLLEMASAA